MQEFYAADVKNDEWHGKDPAALYAEMKGCHAKRQLFAPFVQTFCSKQGQDASAESLCIALGDLTEEDRNSLPNMVWEAVFDREATPLFDQVVSSKDAVSRRQGRGLFAFFFGRP